MHPERAAKDHHDEHGCCAEGQPACVGADVAGDLRSGGPGKSSRDHARRAAGAIDDAAIEDEFEEAAGKHHQRDDEEVGIELVDPVFVCEQRIGGLIALGERSCRARLLVVAEVGDIEAEDSNENKIEARANSRPAEAA